MTCILNKPLQRKTGTDALLQKLGRVTAIVRLTGTENGTAPVSMEQAQSEPPLTRPPNALQQSAVGDPDPPPPVI